MLICVDALRTFFAKIASGWYWILGGLLLAVILAVALCAIFRIKNKTAVSLFVIVFAIFGAVLTYSSIYVDLGGHIDPGLPSAVEIVAELDTFGKDNWENTNGGFTYEQIKKVQKDNEAPTLPDVIIDINFQDFGAYKTFSMKLGEKYYNISFIEINDNVLFFDGSMMQSGHFELDRGFFVDHIKFDDWVWNIDNTNLPAFSLGPRKYRGTNLNRKSFYTNIISLSKRDGYAFMDWYYKLLGNEDKIVTNSAFKIGREYTYNNLYYHFINFNGNTIELVGTADTATLDINNFYSYLYSVAKNLAVTESKLVDVSANGLLCAPIPENERQKYPISSSKLSDYNDAGTSDVKYYGVYNCNIGVNLIKCKANTDLEKTEGQDDYIKDIEPIIELPDITKIEQKEYFKVYVNFEDTNNSNVNDDVLVNNPVLITFTNGSDTKCLYIDNLNNLMSNNIVLLSGKNWNYEITSNALIFENFSGSFDVVEITYPPTGVLPSFKKYFSVTFKYYYMDNFVMASVGLNPIGTINRSEFDLSVDPVKVILTNKVSSKVYQFVFDNNNMLDSKVNLLVELGDYTYNILSSKLIFASVTGELTITSTNKIMLFNYAQNLSKDDLKFKISIGFKPDANNRKIRLSADSSYVDVIRNKLSAGKVYVVDITFFDAAGVIAQKFSHEHSSSGACSDSWTASNLVDNTEYTVQVRFTDKYDSTKTYLSDVATVTYAASSDYAVYYTATAV